MLKAIEAYLALRRATGFTMLNAEYLLKSFAVFATERGEKQVHTQTAIDWAARGPSVAQRDARLKAVCRFVRYVRVEDARHELPPANHFGARKTRRSPHIYSAAEIDRLIEAESSGWNQAMVKAAAPLELKPMVARPSGFLVSFTPARCSTRGSTSRSTNWV